MSQRETWATRVGFLVAAIGSAVGLGNIWQFPFKTATNGGAVFLVFYLLAVFLIGFPAMLAEFVLGRRTQLNVIDAFENLGHRQWRIVGAISLFTGFWILSYYNIVGGWVLQYIYGSLTGAYFGDPGGYFSTISSGMPAIVGQVIFLGIVVGIVAFGIENGIEKATKVMVPSIVLLMVALAAWAFTLGGATEGLTYFLSPDIGSLVSNAGTVVPDAVGQAFFTLSLGMGIMITFSSYVADDDNLLTDGGIIVVTNTLVGVLAGLVVFPILFANNIGAETSGPSALFVAMARAFGNLPAGRILGVIFFGVVAMAALSSAISLLEVTVSWANDNYDIPRPYLSIGAGVGLFLLGLPSTLDTGAAGGPSAWFVWFDSLAYQLFLPLSVLLVLLFVGWVLAGEALMELRQGAGSLDTFGPVWLWMIRTVVLVGMVVTLFFGVQGLFLGENPAFFAPF